MMRRLGVFAALVILLAAGSVLLAQSNPFVGTWKLNLASSKFNPGPPPQSQTRTWDASGMVMVKGIGAAGKPSSYGYSVKGDGKETPVMGAIPNHADMISTKKIDANTYEAKFTKAGKQIETTTYKVSNGGKTLTIHAMGSADAGFVENVQVLDKQ
jgi:hypothetical protein